MTKRRTPGTLAHAVTVIVAELTEAVAAETVGKGTSIVRAWTDPTDNRKPSMLQVRMLDAAMKAEAGSTPIRDWLDAELAKVDAPAHEAVEPLERLGELNKEFGEFAAALAMAGNGNLSNNLSNHLLKELDDLDKKSEAARRDIEARTVRLGVAK